MTREDKNVFLSKLDGLNPDRWTFLYLSEDGWHESKYYTSLEEAQTDWKEQYDGPDYTTEIRKETFTLPYCNEYNYIIPLIQNSPEISLLKWFCL